MKKLLSVFLCLLLTALTVCGALPVAAAGAFVAVSAPSSATVGSTVTVKVTYTADTSIGSAEGTLSYDTALMSFVSASGVETYGDAGITKFVYYDALSTKKTLSFSLTFKAKAAGSCTFSLATTELASVEENLLGNPSGKATVSVKNPQKSGNADLASLSVSAGTLSPKFSAKVTAYNIVIPYSVTSLLVSANAADKNAKVAVTGSQKMQVGKNTRAVTVTAPNGTTKTYTLTITRQENTGTATDPTTPAVDASKVTVGAVTKTIKNDLADIPLPAGFEATTVTVNETTFPAAQNATHAVTLLYLTDEDGQNGAFYLYNTTNMTFSDFFFDEVKAGVYVFLTPENTDALPQGAAQTFLQIGEKTVAAWSLPDEREKDFYLVYALSPAGNTGFYRYDKAEGTFQRYIPPAEDTTAPVDTEVQPERVGILARVSGFFSDLIVRFGKVRVIAVGVGAPLLLAAIIVLIVLIAKKPRNFKH